MTRLPSLLAAAAAAALTLSGGAVLAQDQGTPAQAAPVSEASTLAEVEQQKAANKAMADFAAQQVADNKARLAAHEQAQAAYEAELARVEKERTARDALIAKDASEHAVAVAKWRADIAACKDGDETKCPATAQAEPEKRGLRRLLPF